MLRILPMTDGQAAGALLTASLGGLGRGGVAEEVAGTLSVAVSVQFGDSKSTTER